MKILLWVLSAIALLSSIFFAMWAIQAVWLSGFTTGPLVHDYTMRFYTRCGLAVLLAALSIALGYRASKTTRPK